MTLPEPDPQSDPQSEPQPEPALQPVTHAADSSGAWWRSAVIYQVYPRSWADADGDGIGDLPGITARLDHLVELGVDALWLSPFYASPMHDAGYDVADYRAVDALFGTLADADALVARAHQLGLRVIIDLVPNHTSSDHPWFQEALAAPAGSPARARYLFREGSGPEGSEPPNDWRSVFGGRAWSRVPDPRTGDPGQWYLHLFDVTQPDLDWTNPQVHAEFEAVLRFWLDRGVDGFRVDVAHGLVKEPGLPDWSAEQELLSSGEDDDRDRDDAGGDRRAPMWDQDGVHDIYRAWRRVLNTYNPPDAPDHDPALDRILCAEAWVDPLPRAARYVRPDEMHQAFNFEYLQAPWTAAGQRAVIAASYAACDAVGAPTTWVLSNHDVIRHATRLALDSARRTGRGPQGLGATDPVPDAALGLRRARAATAIMLALPGSAYLYQGEELGLPEHTSLPDELRQDPTWVRTDHGAYGRDGCRVPMPWAGDAPAYGFNTTGASWLPQPAAYGALAVDRQQGVPGSTYELYRTLLRIRRDRRLGTGELRFVAGYTKEVLAFEVRAPGRPGVLVLANLGTAPIPLPADARVLVGSAAPTADGAPDGSTLPVDGTVWLAAD
ncbi:MAG: glycoside hydrolase family 13 protein [Actinobacteria bacterium]|nr:glycoside hydrolase family 13 protein [Actinomycetota bacterium]